jgi:hypothetical protein
VNSILPCGVCLLFDDQPELHPYSLGRSLSTKYLGRQGGLFFSRIFLLFSCIILLSFPHNKPPRESVLKVAMFLVDSKCKRDVYIVQPLLMGGQWGVLNLAFRARPSGKPYVKYTSKYTFSIVVNP